MIRTFRAAAVVALALSFPAGARAADTAELWERRCSSCHGKDGRGNTAMGRRMKVRDLAKTAKSEAELAKDIAEGIPERKMPAYEGKLSQAEIQALARFIKGGLKRAE
jgi:mono/diheme cytochrome c family protein